MVISKNADEMTHVWNALEDTGGKVSSDSVRYKHDYVAHCGHVDPTMQPVITVNMSI
jgi:hypothetical protein